MKVHLFLAEKLLATALLTGRKKQKGCCQISETRQIPYLYPHGVGVNRRW